MIDPDGVYHDQRKRSPPDQPGSITGAEDPRSILAVRQTEAKCYSRGVPPGCRAEFD
jgi:hypothetical protein